MKSFLGKSAMFSRSPGPGIQLERAILCFNCETVSEQYKDGNCRHCGSSSTVNLSRIIPRPSLPVDIIDPARRA